MATNQRTSYPLKDHSGSCEQCGQPTECYRRSKKRKRFCSRECELAWRRIRYRGNKFAQGTTAWNKGIKGLQHSPATQFKKGHKVNPEYPIGTVRIRTDQQGSQRAWVKVADRVWRERAKVIWEAANGQIPKGMIVHHKDRDTLNDDLSNLELLTRANHLNEHRAEHPPKQQQFCKRGHDLSVTRYVSPNGISQCRECVKIRKRESKERMQGAMSSSAVYPMCEVCNSRIRDNDGLTYVCVLCESGGYCQKCARPENHDCEAAQPHGKRGCCATLHPSHGKGFCAQSAIAWDEQGYGWCFFHNPSQVE